MNNEIEILCLLLIRFIAARNSFSIHINWTRGVSYGNCDNCFVFVFLLQEEFFFEFPPVRPLATCDNRVRNFLDSFMKKRRENSFYAHKNVEKHVEEAFKLFLDKKFSERENFLSKYFSLINGFITNPCRQWRSDEEPQAGAEVELSYQSDLYDGLRPASLSRGRLRKGLHWRLSTAAEIVQPFDILREAFVLSLILFSHN